MTTKQYRLRSLIDRVIDYRGVTPTKLGFEWNEDKSGIPAVSALNIKSNRLVKRDEMNYVSDALYTAWMRQEVVPGDLLLTSEAPLGEMYIVQDGDQLCLSQRVFGLRTKKDIIDPKFLYYSLRSEQGQYRLYRRSSGSTAKGIRATELMQVEIDLPELTEQKSLSHFLDNKTQILDKILTTKNHTQTHLSDLRQAIITNAVLGTGGVAVNLQDTNIPWIGKIPVHWQMRKLKDIATVSIGWTPSTSNQEYFEGENVWVTIADMNKKYITRSKAQISDIAVLDAGIKKVPKGSLLYSFKLSVGKVAFAGTDLYTNEAIAAIIPKKDTEIDNDFLYYALSSYMISNANENIYGAKLLNQGLIKNAAIAVPPVEEQRKIAKMLNQKLDKIDHASEENQKSISQLEEYRSSLISSVVGGKVEV